MQLDGYIRGKSHWDGALNLLGSILFVKPIAYSLTLQFEWRGSAVLTLTDIEPDPLVRRETSEDGSREFFHYGWESGEVHNKEVIETPWCTVYLVEFNTHPNETHIFVHLCPPDAMQQTDDWAYLGTSEINPMYLHIDALKRHAPVVYTVLPSVVPDAPAGC